MKPLILELLARFIQASFITYLYGVLKVPVDYYN